jgi:arylsulfatase
MKALGLIAPDVTAFARLPTIPAWDALSDEDKRQSARKMELFAAMLEHMDDNIGRLIGYLKTEGLYENTLIFFMSDNGPEGNMLPIGAPWDNSRFEDWARSAPSSSTAPPGRRSAQGRGGCSRAS